jgi:N-methylhydantoinase A
VTLAAVAADVGGTFTDVITAEQDGTLRHRKLPSTGPEFDRAVVEGLGGAAGERAGDVLRVLHATTAGTNAVLERQGGPAGLITTAGFRDVLEIGRLRTPNIYDLGWRKPPPLVSRSHRLEVTERLDASGAVVTPLDEGSVEEPLDRLVEDGVGSIAIALLHSGVDPRHERELARWLTNRYPNLFVTLASDLVAEPGEVERSSTAALNAYLHPVVAHYLSRLDVGLQSRGFRCPLYILQSSGGLMSVDRAIREPVATLESGPAAGALAASSIAREMGIDEVVSFDMGGTTAKASLIHRGRPQYGNEFSVGSEVSAVSRLLRGGGYVVRLPVIDLAEVGAGGGSIAAIDGGGGLLVGPRSAGADPGPACYGRGGTEPTVTDANLVLGLISPAGLAAGGVAVDVDAAARVLFDRVAKPLGLSLAEAAWAVHTVADHRMAAALKAVTTERGRILGRHTMVAFGGSGPLHAATLADVLGMGRVVVPDLAGVLSARGLLTAPAEVSAARSIGRRLNDVGDLSGFIAEMRTPLEESLRSIGFSYEQFSAVMSFEMRFPGQVSDIRVEHEGDDIPTISVLETGFRELHDEAYGHSPDREPWLTTLRLALRATWEVAPYRGRRSDSDTALAARTVWIDAREAVQATVHNRSQIEQRGQLVGPFLVDDPDTTTFVPPGWAARCDGAMNLILERT